MEEDFLSGESQQDMESLSSRPLPRLGDSPFFIPEFFGKTYEVQSVQSSSVLSTDI